MHVFSLYLLILAILKLMSDVEVEGQGHPEIWTEAKNDSEKNLSIPSHYFRDDEIAVPGKNRIWNYYWAGSGVAAAYPDLFENSFLPVSEDKMQLAPPLWGNPPFFCIDIPKMLHEAYYTKSDGMGGVEFHPAPKNRQKINKFNKEGVGWETTQKRSKSRYFNAYSLFWIMEPTSFRWNRRFAFRINAAKHLGESVDDMGWALRERPAGFFLKRFLNKEYDPYNSFLDGLSKLEKGWWTRVQEAERKRVEDEGLYWHVDVTGIRNTRENNRTLKGWYHLKITLRKTMDGTKPVLVSEYVIDRLAVSARGLTFNHEFINTGPNGFHTTYDSVISDYFGGTGHSYNNRPHKVWEGGAGEFVHDFPKCTGVPKHTYAERQFVPCGTTGRSQWYYGNNFIYVKTNYPGYPDDSVDYGGGVVQTTTGGAEEIHLNYKLDQSFCNMYLAVDFVVNGVVIKAEQFPNVVQMSPFEWVTGGNNASFAVERSSSTRITFVKDDYVNPPEPSTCPESYRKYGPPVIKADTLPSLTFYGNADPIPSLNPGEELELDCFVPLMSFNSSNDENSFQNAIQDILPAENFSSLAASRGLTLSYWYLYITPFGTDNCVPDEEKLTCTVFAEHSKLIRIQVGEWNWYLDDPSNRRGSTIFDKTRLPVFDGTHKGSWLSYFDWVDDGLDPIYNRPIPNLTIARFGEDRAWATSRQMMVNSAVFYENVFTEGSFFQRLYFKGIPFVGRATADRSHQSIYNGAGQSMSTLRPIIIPYSGEPGHSPPACDLHVSRYYLRILDQDDEQHYHQPVGSPNNPNDTCFIENSLLTTDPALQYVRKVYISPKNKTGRKHPTWYEIYVERSPTLANERCDVLQEIKKMMPNGKCTTMPPMPYTTEPTVKQNYDRVRYQKGKTFRHRVLGNLSRRWPQLRGMPFENPAALFVWDLRIMHGILMAAVGFFVVPINIFMSRYYGTIFLNSGKKRLVNAWYFMHTFGAALTLILLIVGIFHQNRAAAVLGRNWNDVARYHRRMGWSVFFFSFWLFAFGGVKFKNKFLGQIISTLHFLFSVISYVLILACIATSVVIPGSPASYLDYGLIEVYYYLFFTKEFAFLVLLFWVVFDIEIQIFMVMYEIHTRTIVGAAMRRPCLPFPVPVFPLGYRFEAPPEWQRKILLLWMYTFVALVCTVLTCTGLIIITPFTMPTKGLGWMSCSHFENGTVRETFPKDCPDNVHIDEFEDNL